MIETWKVLSGIYDTRCLTRNTYNIRVCYLSRRGMRSLTIVCCRGPT